MRFSSLLLLRFSTVLAAVALLGFPTAASSILSTSVTLNGPAGGSGLRCNFQIGSNTGAPSSGSVESASCAVGASGSYSLSGSASSSYGTLRAASQMRYEQVSTGGSRIRGIARADAGFSDYITLDIAGRSGEVVDLVFRAALSGTSSALVDGLGFNGETFSALAAGLLRVRVAGSRYNIDDVFDSRTGLTRTESGSGTVQITLGQPFQIGASLHADTEIQALSASLAPVTIFVGDAVAPFGASGGLTSFELFDLGGQPIPDFTLTSTSGEFQFYVVPEPSTGLLVMVGLLGLGFRRQYSPAAN